MRNLDSGTLNYVHIEKLFNSHSQLLPSLLAGNPKKTYTDQSILYTFLICPKKRFTNPQREQQKKTFSPVFM